MFHDPNFCQLVQIDAHQAVEYWESAFNNSVYNHPHFLQTLSHETHWWLGLRKNSPMILWPVCINELGKPYLPKDLFFVGPIWLYNINQSPSYAWVNHYRELAPLFINAFIEHYNGFCFDLPLGMLDVRPFLPGNIILPHGMTSDVRIRYTSRITELDTRNYDDVLNDMKLDRRQKIRQFDRRSSIEVLHEYNETEVLNLYRDFIATKQFVDAEAKINYFKNVLSLVQAHHGHVLLFRDKATLELVACSVLFIHQGVCNLMYQMYSPTFRQSGGTPWVMNEVIKFAKSQNCGVFDFNGGNHLDLAHDKHSYGADAFPYFRVVSSNLTASN